MASYFNLGWHGERTHGDVQRAARKGIDTTLAGAVREAKQRAPVQYGILQGSLRFEPAKTEGSRTFGVWGSFDVNYALWQEIGTSRMPAQPYLRPSADAHYPRLAENIRGFLQ